MSAFGTAEFTRRTLRRQDPTIGTTKLNLITGAAAGAISNFFFVPMELLKSRAQMSRNGNLNYSNEIARIVNSGGLRGLYRGYWACLSREIPGWAAFFAVYEKLKERISTQNSERKIFYTMSAGGVAGIVCRIVTIPQDCLKCKI